MKPTLKQILNFGVNKVKKEKYNISKGKEYIYLRKSKRYSKELVTYTANIFFGYSVEDIAKVFNIKKQSVYINIYRVKKSNSKQEIADEIYQSLNYMYKDK